MRAFQTDAPLAGNSTTAVIFFVLKTQQEVADGRPARMMGFGTFETYTSKATTRRNPKTGQPVQVPELKRIRFKPHQQFKSVVNKEETKKK